MCSPFPRKAQTDMPTDVAKDCEIIDELCRAALAKQDPAVRAAQISIMEICGTHTMAIARSGLRSILPKTLKLISGPGCPVCVTDQSYMDQAVYLARGGAADVTLTRPSEAPSPVKGEEAGRPFDAPVVATYGDMVRVPGRMGSLADARAAGADVEVVYSADQAVELAKARPDRQVVFLGVGFETTTPGTGLSILRARDEGVANYSVLAAHKLVLPAMHALMAAGDVRVDGFLCPGHVSVILGYRAYDEIAARYGRPCVVAGFDASQVVAAIIEILKELIDGKPKSCTVYPSVSAGGNPAAMKLIEQVFMPADAAWRAIGVIPGSGLAIRPQFAAFDAAKRFDLPTFPSYEMPGCRCGDVICGRIRPPECKLFGKRCTPRDPVGPCMVSTEGACAAAYKYERFDGK